MIIDLIDQFKGINIDFSLIGNDVVYTVSWIWIGICTVLYFYYMVVYKFKKSGQALKGITSRIYLALFICIGFSFQRELILAIMWFIISLLSIRNKKQYMNSLIVYELDSMRGNILQISSTAQSLSKVVDSCYDRIAKIEDRIGSEFNYISYRECEKMSRNIKEIVGNDLIDTEGKEITDSKVVSRDWYVSLLDSIQEHFNSAHTIAEVSVINEILEVLCDPEKYDIDFELRDSKDSKESEDVEGEEEV